MTHRLLTNACTDRGLLIFSFSLVCNSSNRIRPALPVLLMPAVVFYQHFPIIKHQTKSGGSIDRSSIHLQGYWKFFQNEPAENGDVNDVQETRFNEPLRVLSDEQLALMNIRYYNPDIHRASFVFPQFIRKVSAHLRKHKLSFDVLVRSSIGDMHDCVREWNAAEVEFSRALVPSVRSLMQLARSS
jgi:hypothetical protein